MATILLRETGNSTGSTVKGLPLTNAEIDTNIDNLNKAINNISSLNDIILAGTKKLYMDGVAGVGGDTYLLESSANVLDAYVGGVNTLKLTATGASVTGTISATDTVTLTGAIPLVVRDTAAYSAGISGPILRMQSLDSTSANNNTFALYGYALAGQQAAFAIRLGYSGSTTEVFRITGSGSNGNAVITGTLSSTGVADASRFKPTGAPLSTEAGLSLYNSAPFINTPTGWIGYLAVAGSGILSWNAAGVGITGTLAASGIVSITDTTEATSTVAASAKTAGGLAVAKSLRVGLDTYTSGSFYAAGGNNTLALRSTNVSTGYTAIQLTNTGGNAIFGMENSTGGNNLIVGATGYDTILRGPSGIAFSANNGAAMQMRLSSTGLTVTGALSATNNITTSAGQITAGVVGTSGVQIINNGTIGTMDAQDLNFRTASVSRLTINASTGDIAIISTTDATSTTAASLKTAGGLGVAKKAYFGDSVYVSNTTTGGSSLQMGPTSPSVNSSAQLRMIYSNTVKNWLIGTNGTTAGALEFTPSSTVGGTSFTTPVLTLTDAGLAVTGTLSATGFISSNIGADLGTTGSNGVGRLTLRGTADATITMSTVANSFQMGFTSTGTQRVYIKDGGLVERLAATGSGVDFIGRLSGTSGTYSAPSAGGWQINGSATGGMVVSGAGSTHDFVLANSIGSSVAQIPTGTTRLETLGVLSVLDTTDATSSAAASLKTAGGLAVAKSTWLGGLSDTTTSTLILGNATNSVMELYNASASVDQKRWGIQSGTAVGDGIFRIRAFNDARTNGLTALSFSRTGIASVIATLHDTTNSSSTTTGALVVSGGMGLAKNLVQASTMKHYLDGGGDTYIVESSANVMDLYAGGVKTVSLTPTGAAVTGSLSTTDITSVAVDRLLSTYAILDVFLYDTEKDSDGGAWRHRCSHTSWENETLAGSWLGVAVNEAAARAIAGATTGSYYYDSTSNWWYSLNAGSGVTLVYRGNARKFPAKALITADSYRVVIHDLTQANAPMWMVFAAGSQGMVTVNMVQTLSTARSVAMLNGTLVEVHNTGSDSYGAPVINFISEFVYRMDPQYTSEGGVYKGNIAARNSASGYGVNSLLTKPVISSQINDVAMTVLPNAPVDVATGLPVPTIAVATAGGVSVITDTGSVWDIVPDGGAAYCFMVAFTPEKTIMFENDGNGTRRSVRVDAIPTADTTHVYTTKNTSLEFYDNGAFASVPDLSYRGGVGTQLVAVPEAIGTELGLNIFKRNPSTPSKGMVAYVTKDFNSGWQVGAIKGAWLADTVAETLVGTDLVTNGSFASDTAWTKSAGVTISGGTLNIDGTVFSNATGYQNVGLVSGKTYVTTLTVATGSGNLSVYTGVNTLKTFAVTAGNTYSVSGVAAGDAVLYIQSNNTSFVGAIDNVSCRLADVDRSIKAKGLQAFGSLTKAAVASGAALMGYSGFSAANYLEQPYNSDLDFGTGDFCILGWASYTTYGANFRLLDRSAAAYANAYIAIELNANTGVFSAYTRDSGGVTTASLVSSIALASGVMTFFALVRRSGVMEWHINAVAAGTVANTNNLTNTSAYLRLGKKGSAPDEPWSYGQLALLRFAATAPSAEQIKHIYETEKGLFSANAQCCLAGTSNTVTALAYDDETDLLHAGTSYGRSTFKGLVRTASEATAVGSITALSASGGIIAQGGASGVDIYVPAYNLREELCREAEQVAKFGAALVATRFTATASQTSFQLPVGYEIEIVYRNGMLLWPGSTEDYTTTFDGFRWSVVLADASVVGDQITVMGVRRNG
jgi:hypothetical protein